MNCVSGLLSLLLVLVSGTCSMAAPAPDPKLAVVRDMIAGYNNQDYAALKRPWAAVGKLIVSQNMLRAELEPMFLKYGVAAIDTVTHSEYTYIAKLRMAKAPDPLYLQFVFNDKSKLEGFGFAYPPLIYRRRMVPKAIEAQALNRSIDSLMTRRHLVDTRKPFNGSVMVVDAGDPVYVKHFGYADLERRTPINDSTMYELASCSKQFTALAILQLEKAGRLRLDDSLQRFLPGLPYPGVMIRHLLTHTSGLPDYQQLLQRVWDKSRFAGNEDVLRVLIRHRPKAYFLPGARFEYCNTGYALLSLIVERASGQSFGEYLAATVFGPLGMRHTRVYNTRREKGETLDNYAFGYIYDDARKRFVLPDSSRKHAYVVYQDPITGDGSVNSCTADLLKWSRELLAPSVIDPSLLQQAMTDNTTAWGKRTSYGYGFFLRGDGLSTERLVMHTGGWPGYTTAIMNFPDQRKQIVILSNTGYDGFTRLADDIAGLLLE